MNRSGVDLILYNIYPVSEFQFCLDSFTDVVDTVHNRRVISFSHDLSDVDQRGGGEFPAQVHCNVSGLDKLGISLFGGNVFRVDAKMLCHHIDDKRGRDLLWLVRIDHILECFLCMGESDVYLI